MQKIQFDTISIDKIDSINKFDILKNEKIFYLVWEIEKKLLHLSIHTNFEEAINAKKENIANIPYILHVDDFFGKKSIVEIFKHSTTFSQNAGTFKKENIQSFITKLNYQKKNGENFDAELKLKMDEIKHEISLYEKIYKTKFSQLAKNFLPKNIECNVHFSLSCDMKNMNVKKREMNIHICFNLSKNEEKKYLFFTFNESQDWNFTCTNPDNVCWRKKFSNLGYYRIKLACVVDDQILNKEIWKTSNNLDFAKMVKDAKYLTFFLNKLIDFKLKN